MHELTRRHQATNATFAALQSADVCRAIVLIARLLTLALGFAGLKGPREKLGHGGVFRIMFQHSEVNKV